MTIAKPAFATLTGCNRSDVIKELQDIAAQFPTQVEFGVLISEEKTGTGRFATKRVVDDLRAGGLRLSAHLCGALADQVFAGRDIDLDLSGFSRVQINLPGRYASPDEAENAIQFAMSRGVRAILQCADGYPCDTRCDWLLDKSFGSGRAVQIIPDMSQTKAFCGISGGLNEKTVLDTLRMLPVIGGPYWIDAESALFDGDTFSTQACRAFLTCVFG